MNKNRIKVCFIAMGAHPLFDPSAKGFIGGMEVGFHNLSRRLAEERDMDIHFITGGERTFTLNDPESGLMLHSYVRVPPSLPSRIIPHPLRFIKLLKSVNCDIYVQGAAGRITALIAFFCACSGKKFIYKTAHKIDCDGTYIKEKGLDGFLFGRGLARADAVITLGEEYREMLEESTGKESVVINNAFPLSRFHNTGGGDFILWVGRSEQWKRAPLFIGLARNLPGYKFVMVCSPAADREYFEHVKRLASGVDNLEFYGGLPFDRTDELFNDAALFVNTSSSEGFPQTFIQAMSRGVPILSLLVGPDDFLKKNDVGFRCETMEELEKKLILMMKNDGLRSEMGRQAYAYAMENHNLENQIDRYRRLFRRLLDE